MHTHTHTHTLILLGMSWAHGCACKHKLARKHTLKGRDTFNRGDISHCGDKWVKQGWFLSLFQRMLTPTKSRLSWLFLLSLYTAFIPFCHFSVRLKILQWDISSFWLCAPFSANFGGNSPAKLWHSMTCLQITKHILSISCAQCFCICSAMPFTFSKWLFSNSQINYKQNLPCLLFWFFLDQLTFPFSKSLLYQRGCLSNTTRNSSVLWHEDGWGGGGWIQQLPHSGERNVRRKTKSSETGSMALFSGSLRNNKLFPDCEIRELMLGWDEIQWTMNTR